jgi:Leucine-rich repeat (LRR) protein
VCTDWTDSALDPRLWRVVSFDHLQANDATFLRVCRRYPDMTSLSLCSVSVHVSTLSAIFRSCSRITSLTLAGARVLGGCLEHVLKDVALELTGLVELDLTQLAVTNGMLRWLDDGCPCLRTLDLSSCTLLPCETVVSGARLLHVAHAGLKELKLCSILIAATELNCPALEVLDASDYQLSDAALLPMVRSSPRLRSLRLAGCRNVSDVSIEAVLRRCAQLRALDVSGCWCLTAQVLREALGASSKIERFEMAGCPLLTDLSTLPVTCASLLSLELAYCDALKALDISSPSLVELSLVGCRALTKLTAHCSQLHTLALERCESLRALELRAPLATLAMPHSCGTLKELALHDERIVALSLHAFLTLDTLTLDCPALQTLDLSRCCALSDASVAALGASCPQLLELNLNECEALSRLLLKSASVTALTLIECKALVTAELRCASLSSIDLEGCSALCVAEVSCAVRRLDLGTCHQLRQLQLHSERCHELVLKGCLRLTVAHLHCAALRALDLSFCAELTDSSLSAFGSASVHELNISNCLRISNALVARVLEVFPALTLLNVSYLSLDDPTLHALLRTARLLRTLELAACKELNFELLADLLAGAPDALPALATLDISYTTACARVVALWLQLCPGLRSLKLNGCALSTAPADGQHADAVGSLRCLSEHASLRQIGLVGCNLSRLVLHGSDTLTELNVRSCGALRSLELRGCASLRAVSACDCAELEAVTIVGCAGLDALDLRKCPAANRIQVDLADAALRRVLRQ